METGAKYFDKHDRPLMNGDVIDLHQTVNGQNVFVAVDIDALDFRYYHDMTIPYEYSVEDMLKPCKFQGVTEWEIIASLELDAVPSIQSSDEPKQQPQTDLRKEAEKHEIYMVKQELIEAMADFLDGEYVILKEALCELKDPVPREKSELHLRMATAAMDEYLKTMLPDFAQPSHESTQSVITEAVEALREIETLCGTVNFSSHNQMREAIEGSLGLAESSIEKLKSLV